MPLDMQETLTPGIQLSQLLFCSFPTFLFLHFPDGFGNKLPPPRQSLNKARLSHPLLPRMHIHESEMPTTLVVAVRGLSDWIHVGKASELKVRYLCCYFSFVVRVTDRDFSGSDECRCTLEVHHRAVHLFPRRCVGRPRLCFQILVLICRTLLQFAPSARHSSSLSSCKSEWKTHLFSSAC